VRSWLKTVLPREEDAGAREAVCTVAPPRTGSTVRGEEALCDDGSDWDFQHPLWRHESEDHDGGVGVSAQLAATLEEAKLDEPMPAELAEDRRRARQLAARSGSRAVSDRNRR
jgi:hypothetical protein